MNYYLISDNNFFLLGMQEVGLSQKDNYTFIHTCDMTREFLPSDGDVVLYFISDSWERSRLLCLPELASCRVMLLLNMDASCQRGNYDSFPWLIPDKSGPEMLQGLLFMAGRADITRRTISGRDELVFRCLSKGCPTLKIHNITGLSEKRISAIKRKMIEHYGVQGHGPAMTLLCRDIIRSCTITEKLAHAKKCYACPYDNDLSDGLCVIRPVA
ncbi:hypothetical protein [Klebsiella oxytoca]|uniref:hypothetical protein n=1 Tax=Klebsiella oxytoca TaxID=571 RepID=UPI0039C90C2C